MTNPKVEVLSIAQGATPDLQNVNKHTQRGRGLHENSMRKRGAGRSIFSAGAGVDVPVVMGGNQTLEIAATLGMEIINVHTTGNQIVNVVRDDIAPGSAEFYAMGIEDNEIGKLSYNPDVDILAAVMADPAMQALKAEDKMLADIVEGMGMPKETKDAEPQTDRAGELAEKWATASGQLWKLGDHRLLIGDCTVRENVERLMGGERADCVFTDPPYNVGKNYAGEDLSADEFEKFHSAWMSEMEKIISPDTPVYACFGAKWLFEFTDILRRIIKKPRLLVWYKPDSHGVGGGDYFYNYEAILYGSVSGQFSIRSYEGEARDVWIINKAKESDGGFEHSTVKPLEVPTAALLTSSKTGWVIYEPFCGSGSTLLAAHNLGRKCYSLEISEKYGAVILQRFLDATGIQPELMG